MKKITLKRAELNSYLGLFNGVAKLPGKAFGTIINANRDMLVAKIEETNAKLTEGCPEGFKEFSDIEQQLIFNHAHKDQKGNPIRQGSGVAIKNVEAFNAERNELVEKYKDKFQSFDDYKSRNEAILNEELQLNFAVFKFEEVSEQISADQLDFIKDFIDTTIF